MQLCLKKSFNQRISSNKHLLLKEHKIKVTKLYSHNTFEQERFKKDFILMNQRSRQNAKKCY